MNVGDLVGFGKRVGRWSPVQGWAYTVPEFFGYVEGIKRARGGGRILSVTVRRFDDVVSEFARGAGLGVISDAARDRYLRLGILT